MVFSAKRDAFIKRNRILDPKWPYIVLYSQIAKRLEVAGSRVCQWPRLFTDPSALPFSMFTVFTSWSQEGFQRTALQLLKTASGAERKEREEGSPPHALSPFIREKSPSQKLSSRMSLCLIGQNWVIQLPLAGKASLQHPYPKDMPFGAPARCGEGLLEDSFHLRPSRTLTFEFLIWSIPWTKAQWIASENNLRISSFGAYHSSYKLSSSD